MVTLILLLNFALVGLATFVILESLRTQALASLPYIRPVDLPLVEPYRP